MIIYGITQQLLFQVLKSLRAENRLQQHLETWGWLCDTHAIVNNVQIKTIITVVFPWMHNFEEYSHTEILYFCKKILQKHNTPNYYMKRVVLHTEQRFYVGECVKRKWEISLNISNNFIL